MYSLHFIRSWNGIILEVQDVFFLETTSKKSSVRSGACFGEMHSGSMYISSQALLAGNQASLWEH